MSLGMLRPVELSPPKSISGTTSSTAGDVIPISIEGNVFELVVRNKSLDYSLYISLDFGDTWIEIPADSQAVFLLGGLADPVILVKSDGASQSFVIVYRLRM